MADIVPRGVGPLVDAAALLRFANQHGFLVAAAGGLVRTALSDYRRKRSEYGLLQLDETEIVSLAREAEALRRGAYEMRPGHNPRHLPHHQLPKLFFGFPTARARPRQMWVVPRHEVGRSAAPVATPSNLPQEGTSGDRPLPLQKLSAPTSYMS